MPWVKLTDTDNEPVWINTDNFNEMRCIDSSDAPYTMLYGASGASADGSVCKYMQAVVETREQILRMSNPKL